MTRVQNYLMFISAGVAVVAIPALATGAISLAVSLCLGAGIGLGAAMEADGIRLIWQSPRIFQCAGLYLKLRSKRYRLIKVGLV